VGHYDVLGVRPDASAAELRQAYLDLARRHHPDRLGGSTERMRVLNEAWETLGDPERRQRYDRSLTGPAPRPSATWTAPAGAPPSGHPRSDLGDPDEDRPIGGTVKLPSWFAVLPPGVLVLGVLIGLFGLVFRLAAVVAFAVALGGCSVALFLLSPFVALAASRRR
jgi:preprotein translocase subunit Sec63